jgi:hypothetical protein
MGGFKGGGAESKSTQVEAIGAMIPSIFICWGFMSSTSLFLGICSTGSEDWSNDGDLFLDIMHRYLWRLPQVIQKVSSLPCHWNPRLSLSLSEFYVWRVM